MGEDDWLAVRFEENRDHLRTVAFRILGSAQEAEDAVQESWLRLSRSDADTIDNLHGWLTTVVGRICLDVLRRRREHPVAEPSPASTDPVVPNPEHEALQAESVGLALLVVLEKLTPAERLAFVLHDMFAVPYDDIAPIVGRSASAARQLASRARRQVQQPPQLPHPTASKLKPTPPSRRTEPARESRQRELVAAFLAASRGGDFEALLEVLDPDVVLRADGAAAGRGAASLVRGSAAVAETFSGRAAAARLVLVNGIAGAVWSHRGEPQVVFQFSFAADRISAIDLLGDPDYLRDVELSSLEG